jgi:hypothetical protein
MKIEFFVSLLLILILAPIACAQNVTREQAVKAINQATADINEMGGAGFVVKHVDDILTSAKQALERADFAELIRQNATGSLAQQAKKALEGLNYQGFTYDEVLKYTREISSRKQQAYELSDSIRALEIKIEDYKKSINTSEAERILGDVKIAFENERYTETEDLLSKANTELENRKSELATINIIVRFGKNFVEKNWLGILITSIVITVAGWFGWRKYRIKRIRDKLKKLRIEKESLVELMKKTQVERFKKGKLSEAIYKIRMGKYSQRMNEVKGTIPVLEAMLKKEKKKGFKKG